MIIPSSNNPVGPLLKVVTMTKIVNIADFPETNSFFSEISKNILNEARRMTRDVMDVNTGKMVPTRQVEVQDWLESDSAYERMPTVWGQYTDNRGKGSQKNRKVSFIPGNSLPGVVRVKEIEDAEELGQNWAGPPGENVFMQGIQMGAAPLRVRASEIEEIRERGNNRKGSGKKYQKKSP